MGDMAEPWKSMRHDRQMEVARGERLSMQYHSEKEREKGTQFKYECARDMDQWNLQELEKLGLNPERKGYSSFQITINGRQAMYYCGRKGRKIHYKDGEKVELGYDKLTDYLIKSEKEEN